MKDHPLKLLRTTLSLTQAQLADAIGVTPGRISQVEQNNGERLGIDNVLKLTELYRVEIARLGLTLEDLLRGTQPTDGAAA